MSKGERGGGGEVSLVSGHPREQHTSGCGFCLQPHHGGWTPGLDEEGTPPSRALEAAPHPSPGSPGKRLPAQEVETFDQAIVPEIYPEDALQTMRNTHTHGGLLSHQVSWRALTCGWELEQKHDGYGLTPSARHATSLQRKPGHVTWGPRRRHPRWWPRSARLVVSMICLLSVSEALCYARRRGPNIISVVLLPKIHNLC